MTASKAPLDRRSTLLHTGPCKQVKADHSLDEQLLVPASCQADEIRAIKGVKGKEATPDDHRSAALQAKELRSELEPATIVSLANSGVSGPTESLPFAAQIQASFGHHDIKGTEAHVDSRAANATRAMGAQAYAKGKQVAFGQQPDLHTAAHEAAHVVQQQAGVQLSDGVGRAGDRYEQQADAVAGAVVSGRSAEAILDRSVGPSGTRAGVQRKGSIPRPPKLKEKEAESLSTVIQEYRTTGLQAIVSANSDWWFGVGWAEMGAWEAIQVLTNIEPNDSRDYQHQIQDVALELLLKHVVDMPTKYQNMEGGKDPRLKVPKVQAACMKDLHERLKTTFPAPKRVGRIPAILSRVSALRSLYESAASAGTDVVDTSKPVSAARQTMVAVAKAKVGQVGAKDYYKEEGETRRRGWQKLTEIFNVAYDGHPAPDLLRKPIAGPKGVTNPDTLEIEQKQTNDVLQSWCGIFSVWAARTAGLPVGTWKVGSGVNALLPQVKIGKGEQPQVGDICVNKKITIHHMIITKITPLGNKNGQPTDYEFQVVEGNVTPKSVVRFGKTIKYSACRGVFKVD